MYQRKTMKRETTYSDLIRQAIDIHLNAFFGVRDLEEMFKLEEAMEQAIGKGSSRDVVDILLALEQWVFAGWVSEGIRSQLDVMDARVDSARGYLESMTRNQLMDYAANYLHDLRRVKEDGEVILDLPAPTNSTARAWIALYNLAPYNPMEA
jgi:hypothetical protein